MSTGSGVFPKTLMVAGERVEAQNMWQGDAPFKLWGRDWTGEKELAVLTSVLSGGALLSQCQEPQSSAQVCAFHRHSPNAYHVRDTVVGGDTVRKEAGLLPVPTEFTVGGKHRH